MFSETRRKRKGSRSESADDSRGPDKRRLTTSATYDDMNRGITPNFQYPVSPSYSAAASSPHQWASQIPQPGPTSQPVVRPPGSHNTSMYNVAGGNAPIDTAKTNGNHMLSTAADVLAPPIATSHEALHLLSQAAGQAEEANRHTTQNGHNQIRSPSTTFDSPGSVSASHRRTLSSIMTPGQQGLIDPAMAVDNGLSNPHIEDADFRNALRAWSRMRFVRAGWFTDREAMAYID